MIIHRYYEELKLEWNAFVKEARNTTFLMNRNYMDYHSDKFVDHSLLIYRESELIALFVANQKDDIIQSHGGLSYGGLVYTVKQKTKDLINILNRVIEYYQEQGISEIIYKKIPNIYCRYPSEEDEYALFLKGAELYRRDISTTILIEGRLKESSLRRRLLSKAKKQQVSIIRSVNFEQFFEAYNNHLQQKYKTKAVHSCQEMELLSSRFPDNIIYLEAINDNRQFLGGTILYFDQNVMHIQYTHYTEEGRKAGAFELLFEEVIERFKGVKYFDFGISTENEGRYLNEGLISFKESFGGRATLCDFYKISLR